MSADNGYIVHEVQGKEGLYGIFDYFASNEDEGSYDITRVLAAFGNPVSAILAAHSLQEIEQTEYGVSIQHEALLKALKTQRKGGNANEVQDA